MSDSGPGILQRVAASQYGSGDPLDAADALAALGEAPRPAIAPEDRLEQFLGRLKSNNVSVEVAASRSDAVKRIGRFIYNEHHTHRAVAGNDRRLAALTALPKFSSLLAGSGPRFSRRTRCRRRPGGPAQ